MSLKEFLARPMFPKPEEIYVPLAEFSASEAAGLKAEADKAIAALNLKAKDFSSSGGFARDYLDLISRAETLAKEGQWAEAHKTIWEATFHLNRALESKAAAQFRKCMGMYYGCWILGLAGIGCWLKLTVGDGSYGCYFGAAYWRYVMMGALGGLTVAIWGLSIHSANLDFDRAYSTWYWLKPVLGAIMGLVAVITAQAGLLAIGGQASLPASGNGKLALYILAFLAGFSERFFIGIIDRVMTALLSGGQSPSPSPKPTAPKPPAAGAGTKDQGK
jgi:hypothetical protein